jgi:hypothetical protein
MLQVMANILAVPVDNLDITGSQAYRNGYDLDMDPGHDVDIIVRDLDGLFMVRMAALLAAFPLLTATLEDKGYDTRCLYIDVCGFQVNLIDLDPDSFAAWQHATALVKAEWPNGMETWGKEARVAFFKASRNAYISGLLAGRQGR